MALAMVGSSSGCMGLTPQLHPTDIAALEQLEDRDAREQAYIDNAIVISSDARGVRYTKGYRVGARPRSWQSLDLILRSDRNSAAALPENKIRAARVLTGFMIASALVVVGGIASSAREGLDLSRPTGTSAILIGGAASSLAFGIATGVVWGQARRGYEEAVNVYNDSLALRLGISDANGEYRPPPGVLVDEEGFIILDQRELSVPGMGDQTPEAVEPKAPEPLPIVPVPMGSMGSSPGKPVAPTNSERGEIELTPVAPAPVGGPESSESGQAPESTQPSEPAPVKPHVSLVGPSRS
jgi:hypothetical protein